MKKKSQKRKMPSIDRLMMIIHCKTVVLPNRLNRRSKERETSWKREDW